MRTVPANWPRHVFLSFTSTGHLYREETRIALTDVRISANEIVQMYGRDRRRSVSNSLSSCVTSSRSARTSQANASAKSAFSALSGHLRQVFQVVGPFTQDMPDLHFTRSLDVYRPARFADEVILNQFVSCVCDLNGFALAVGFHPTGHVHSIAPQIIYELLPADDAGHHRARVHANAECQLPAAELTLGHTSLHLERQTRQRVGMVGTRARHAGDDHIAVSNCLDLLQAIFLDQ